MTLICRPTMLQAILESAVTAILAIDRHGRIQNVNPATERMFGYSSEEMLGKPVNMLMPEPYRSQHDGYISRHLATGEKRIIGIGREVMALRRDGTRFPARLSVGQVPDSSPPRFVGLLRDISGAVDGRGPGRVPVGTRLGDGLRLLGVFLLAAAGEHLQRRHDDLGLPVAYVPVSTFSFGL